MTGQKNNQKGVSVLLTGGSGFLGRAIVKELLKAEAILQIKELRILDLVKNKHPEDPRISFYQGDVRDKKITEKATSGVDLVIHSAAIVDWGSISKKEVISVNFEGTLNMLQCARESGVEAFVYTSSLDVLFDGKPKRDVNEEHPYPIRHSTSYCRSKYLAEKAVLEANAPGFKTAVLRPSDIYGEADPFHIGSLVSMAKGGFYVRLGDGSTKSQHVYVGNIAHAHLQLSDALLNGNTSAPGNCYFITDGPGSNFFHFFDAIVEAAGYRIRPKNVWIPGGIAMVIGTISEGIAWLARPIKRYNPKMSRFAVKYTCTDYTFSAEKASRDFGFKPIYSDQEAFELTVAFWTKGGRV